MLTEYLGQRFIVLNKLLDALPATWFFSLTGNTGVVKWGVGHELLHELFVQGVLLPLVNIYFVVLSELIHF
jgi:hypothetical protein